MTACSDDQPITDRVEAALGASNDHTVLILGTSVIGGASSREAVYATAAGYTVEVVTAAGWAAKSAADFATYRALILGDPACVYNLSPVSAAISNRAVWGPVVDGNVILIGTDPVYPAHRPIGGDAVTQGAVQFAAADPEATGAYINLSCYYDSDPVNTAVPLLEPFQSPSTGVFTVRGVGCYNDAHKVADHPSLNGITDAALSNWTCSVHEAFDHFPNDFVPLAIAEGNLGPGTIDFPDGSRGVPYIMARGATPVECGDGELDPTEECDDGNLTPGDGCSEICQLEDQPPVALCADRTVVAGAVCSADANVDNGSFDPDGNLVGCTQSPAGPYTGTGSYTVTLTCTDTTNLSSSCTATVTVVDATPPAITCPSDITLECTDGGAVATYAPTAADNCSVPTTACAPPSGSTFPVGTTAATCTAADDSGNTSSCGFNVTVADTQDPVVITQPVVLWPPNHKYHSFDLADCVTSIVDACNGPLDLSEANAQITHITSDELEDDKLLNGGLGDGNTCSDIVLTGDTSADLRVERSGGSNGRVYTVHFEISDSNGNVTTSSCTVGVPHDQSSTSSIPNDGCRYCEGSGCGSCPGHDAACTY